MKLTLKVISAFLLLILILLLATWLFLRRSLPQTEGSIEIEGVSNIVEIVRDKDGVPHIFAHNDYDAIFAQGYVHAQDRMWQMEFQRRAGAGRLSEVLGKSALDSDKYLRTMGFYRSAKSMIPALDEKTKEILSAYVAGVNAWIEEENALPAEFLILGFKPERWTMADSLVWVKMMALDLSKNYASELRRIRLVRMFGEKRAAEMTPEYPEDGVSIIPAEELPIKPIHRLISLQKKLQDQLNIGGIHKGSNNWVVKGDHTETGKPILANDPHLGSGAPSVWYLNELQGEDLHAIGASMPGLPGVTLGHNEHIAWGVTNFGPDVQDLFIEKINPNNPNQYEVNGKWVNMVIRKEKIYVKDQKKPLIWAARSTRHGPMLSDVVNSSDLSLALKWTALDDGDTTLNAFAGINSAKNWNDFEKALRQYVAPIQNFVYADVEGNIGYIGYGKIPIRRRGDGMLPVPGWNSRYEWKSYIPFRRLPRVLNPDKGFVVTANNRVVPKNYRYFLTKEWATPYRAERITEMIKEKINDGGKINMKDMAVIQGDQKSLQSLEMLPYLLNISPSNLKQEKAVNYLKNWNGSTNRRSIATTIYQAWINHLGNYILKDDLKADLKNNLYTYYANRRMALFLLEILKTENSAWCDNVLTPKQETCQEAITISLREAIAELEELIGPDMEEWQWGKLHKTQFPHRPFSRISFLKPFFHLEIENGGARSTVNPASPNYSKGYKNYHIPSVRMLVDMNDFNKSKFIHPPGQSGNFISSHYDDLMERHNKVEYLDMTFGRENTSGDVLILKPMSDAHMKKSRFFKKADE